MRCRISLAATIVEALPAAGKIGAAIKILGTNLAGASGVTFNGVAAAFEIVSATEIKVVVPSGASDGPIQVVTPGGTLLSKLAFRVRQ